MKIITPRLILILPLAMASLLPAAPLAAEPRVRLEVLVDGRPLIEHRHADQGYVEATRGREYALRVTNLDAQRVAVAISVDGRNVIDARHTTALAGRKWVLGPWESIVLDGWQVSGSRARRFYFTTEERSHAEWLGDSSQAGVIEAIAFRERQPTWWSSRRPRVSERAEPARQPAPASSTPGEAANLGARLDTSQRKANAERDSQSPQDSAASRDLASEAAATGIGRDVAHDIVSVAFEHESRPSCSARLRYGFRDELVALGVLPVPRPADPWRRREAARGFEPGAFCPAP